MPAGNDRGLSVGSYLPNLLFRRLANELAVLGNDVKAAETPTNESKLRSKPNAWLSDQRPRPPYWPLGSSVIRKRKVKAFPRELKQLHKIRLQVFGSRMSTIKVLAKGLDD